VTGADVLQDLEKNKATGQLATNTATTISATRLFKDKDDLTSVILIIPADSTVFILGADSAFFHVDYLGNEGFIYSRHAQLNKISPVPEENVVNTQPEIHEGTPVREPSVSRYEYLEKKYGPSIAPRLYSHRIWKGMNTQMVKDSWGSPKKINRVISDNMVKEEWIYNNTWLHFQNSTLTEWGPVKK
jgi:hypothetical protein